MQINLNVKIWLNVLEFIWWQTILFCCRHYRTVHRNLLIQMWRWIWHHYKLVSQLFLYGFPIKNVCVGVFLKGYINLSLIGSSHLPYTLTQGEDGAEGSSVDNSDEALDPCFHYSVLDQAWRATNYSSKKVACDRNVQWNGWYRLFYRGKTIQMPEKCVKKEMCGTHAPLWLVGGHPRIRDGVVTRKVCGNWRDNCCLFKSPPIQVKACKGNYYVYKFVKPEACHLAYCAGKMWCTQALRK